MCSIPACVRLITPNPFPQQCAQLSCCCVAMSSICPLAAARIRQLDPSGIRSLESIQLQSSECANGLRPVQSYMHHHEAVSGRQFTDVWLKYEYGASTMCVVTVLPHCRRFQVCAGFHHLKFAGSPIKRCFHIFCWKDVFNRFILLQLCLAGLEEPRGSSIGHLKISLEQIARPWYAAWNSLF